MTNDSKLHRNNKNDARIITIREYSRVTIFIVIVYILFRIFVSTISNNNLPLPRFIDEDSDLPLPYLIDFEIVIPLFFLMIYLALRRKLMEIRKLFSLSEASYAETPMFVLAITGVGVIVLLWLAGYIEVLGPYVDATLLKTPQSITFVSGFFAIHLWHFVDFHYIDNKLSDVRAAGLRHAFETVAGTIEVKSGMKRPLEPDDGAGEENHRKAAAANIIPSNHWDRGLPIPTTYEMLNALKTCLIEVKGDLYIDRLRYGSLPNLYHHDYLPLLSHIYLELSQLRALNVPPRRIQLLGRKWNKRGLRSEYVLVHNISELNAEFSEGREKMDALYFDLTGRLLRQLLKETTSDKEKTFDRLLTLYGEVIKPLNHGYAQYQSRSLKKRVYVLVAPDGGLLEISIQEDRQINI